MKIKNESNLIDRKELLRLLKKERLLASGKFMTMNEKVLLPDDYVRSLVKAMKGVKKDE